MKFTPEQKVLNDLFGNDITYIIPEYQRPYSWDCLGKNDKNNQVNVMWQDLIDFFDTKSNDSYFIGSMVVINDGNTRIFEVIDGQQRLTTLMLLFTAIRCFVNKIINEDRYDKNNTTDIKLFHEDVNNEIDSLVFNKKKFGVTSIEKKVKIARQTGFDYDKILEIVMNCGVIDPTILQYANEEQIEVSKRFFNNHDYLLKECLENRFTIGNVFTLANAKELNGFIDFLKNKVTVIQIRTQDFNSAYQIFEILNNRGLPLSNKDLFRNLIIKEFDELKNSSPKYAMIEATKKWRELDTNYELTTEFISRYVESKRGAKAQSTAFNDLQEIYQKYFIATFTRSKIEIFYEDIEKYLTFYTKIVQLDFSNKYIRHRLAFLLASPNSPQITNLLLALFYAENEEIKLLDFLKVVEKSILMTLVVPKEKFNSGLLYDTIKLLNEKKLDEAKQIILASIRVSDLRIALNGEFANKEATLLMMRYYWALENINPADVVIQTLDYEAVTLEHIIPQNPATGTNWITDFSPQFRKEFTYKLGNMTLLTKSRNSAAKNYDFVNKKAIYQAAKLIMTNNIGNLTKIDETYISDRHQEIVNTLCQDLEL
jgi:uncharacterized protein with ParB-like and HNH nuclease domain